MVPVSLAIDLLKTDGTQTRAVLDETTLGEYAAIWKSGADFPPCVVFHDGSDYWVGGGHHRVAAAHRAGRASVPCIVKPGGKREAIEFGFKDNDTHGRRRTNDDKRFSVNIALDDKEWSKFSSKKIAELVGVSDALVDLIRKQRDSSPKMGVPKKGTPILGDSDKLKEAETRTGKDGKEQPVKKEKPKPVAAVAAVEDDPEVGEEPTLAETCEADNKAIESFCRSLLKFFDDNVPETHWTKDLGRIESARSNIRAAGETLRAAKSVVCPACDEGQAKRGRCQYCKGVGYLPTFSAKAIPAEMRR